MGEDESALDRGERRRREPARGRWCAGVRHWLRAADGRQWRRGDREHHDDGRQLRRARDGPLRLDKAALELLTRAWAAEYGPLGVRVNAVAPGPTRTPGTEPMGDALDQLAATVPLGRPANTEEVSNAALFLGSEEASYVTGAVLAVDGGRTAV